MDKQILVKAANFCAYQERTQDELRQRLKAWNVYGNEAEELIAELISQDYINEERFAKTYAGGKFRVKKWGKIKIEQALKIKGLSDYCIQQGLREIDEEEYFLVLQALLHKKLHEYRELENPFIRKRKTADYAIRKGFESALVWDILREI
ncbi:RecX family transcriptional regulator [Marinilongibacter aquaticus]|uniref:regulatory protein RecX n=1 Tax=Marinilongibacter aquaticus TaxID=2975157 RepID=UPI0021BDD2E1|nr:regulatory protein RecX [Marinilongibacter aquaticus]UBM57899.1 RecX family transcriptional regulator [Marinilongibacter aquaticus]